LRKQDSAWFGSLAAFLAAVLALFQRRLKLAAALGVGAAGLGVASRRWSRTEPGPFPYSLRWILALPHPISPDLLRRGVEPALGDDVLEIGPGTGRHAVQVAQWIAPTGTLHVFDVQQDMLGALTCAPSRRAARSRGGAARPRLHVASRAARARRGIGFPVRAAPRLPFAYVARFEAV
jgi:hypothetical protein